MGLISLKKYAAFWKGCRGKELRIKLMKKRYSNLFWTILVTVNLALMGIAFSFLSSGHDFSAAQKENSRLIGLSYMTMNNEFYKIMSEEINDRIEAEGDRVVMRDPALDPERQIEQIDEMLEMGIDALIVTPVDSDSLAEVLGKAKAQGVLLIVLDTDIDEEGLADCTITSDNYNAGVIVGEYFLSQCRTARVVVMTHQATQSGRQRVQGFVDTVSAQEGIEIVEEIECEGQVETAMPRLQEAIDEGLEFDQVFCLNDLASVGAVAALEENGMLEEVGVYGVDGSPDAKGLINEGMMKATAAQFPTEIGTRAADVLYRLFEGETVEENILVPVELVTQDNVEEFGTDRWQ